MTQNKNPSKDKIKCPICSYEFIPESFHLEKGSFEIVDSEGELMEFQDQKHKLVYKPFSSLKGSWVTYCPECGYIIKFVAEIGKKEILEEASLIKKWGAFKEFGKTYKYEFKEQNKPYMDYLDYFIEKVDNIRKDIKTALDQINFSSWGDPYRDWKHDKNFDTFKFLVRLHTNLEEYCDSYVEDPKSKDMEQKITELNLPQDIEELIQNIRKIRNKIVHEAYAISEEEEDMIENAYIKFMYWIVLKYLEPLNLNKIEIEPDYSFIDIEKVNYEIQTFLHLYLGSTLGIKNFHQTFLTPILKDLGISVKKEL
ncbi:MAG: hypothetical protein ACFFCI_05475 [Promethearchaeota archaeon]